MDPPRPPSPLSRVYPPPGDVYDDGLGNRYRYTPEPAATDVVNTGTAEHILIPGACGNRLDEYPDVTINADDSQGRTVAVPIPPEPSITHYCAMGLIITHTEHVCTCGRRW